MQPKTGTYHGVLYCRVSHAAQVDGTSLGSQESHGRRFCEERRIGVDALFVEPGESAKTAQRTEFLRALEYCRRHQQELDYFIVYKVDRFMRNAGEHFAIRKRLSSYGISLLSVTEPIGESPTERFVEAVLAASAEFDNEVRRVRCTDGMSARIAQGIWPFRPPAGYSCQFHRRHGEKKTEPDPPDERVFAVIQRGLMTYRSGAHTQEDLARLLDDLGLATLRGRRTTAQFVDRLLGKYLAFYAGLLHDPWTGATVRGRHRAMITEDDMHCIRAVRAGKGWTMTRERRHELFPLRGVVRCAECGWRLTAALSRGRHGGRYPYYHCRHKGCVRYGKSVPKAMLEGVFKEFLLGVTPRRGVLDLVREEVVRIWKDRNVGVNERRRGLLTRIEEADERRGRVFEAFERGLYSEDEFMRRKTELDQDTALARRDLAEAKEKQPLDMQEAATAALNLIGNLPEAFSSLPVAQWSRFQKILFPAGALYSPEAGLRTPEKSVIYAMDRTLSAEKSPVVDFVRLHSNQIEQEIAALHDALTSVSTIRMP